MMGARRKLNLVYVQGAIAIAAVLGYLAESWWTFLVAFTVLVGAAVYAGEIRPRRSGSRDGSNHAGRP
jgi:hypothetical protein